MAIYYFYNSFLLYIFIDIIVIRKIIPDLIIIFEIILVIVTINAATLNTRVTVNPLFPVKLNTVITSNTNYKKKNTQKHKTIIENLKPL